MYSLEKIKEHIAEKVNKALGEEIIQAPALVYPPNAEMGDLSLACFSLVKATRKSPAESADFLIGKISADDIIINLKAIGPYLNFTINKEYLTGEVIKEIFKAKEEYGENKSGKGEKVMIEYSNANTHKEYHVGHLRNICYGEAVKRILSVNGYKVIPVSYINDFGIHVAKTLWNYENFVKEKNLGGKIEPMPEEEKGYLLGEIYVDACRREEKDKTAKTMIGFMMKKIESRKGREYELWQKTRDWSIKYFAKIYKELGVEFKNIFYESQYIDKGLKMVKELLAKGILKKSEGAVIADLEKLGVLLFLRSDGTALYPVADIPLAIAKFEKYKIKKSIYVVDIRQSLYFKQIFSVLAKMGYKQKLIHLGYEFVKLPSGMMSSRTGNVITYRSLKEEMLDKAVKETRKRHKDWPQKKVEETAEKITLGAMKFEMIKVSAGSVITFDTAKALQFEGYTAAYLQYTYARIQSIFKKAKKQESKKTKLNFQNLREKKEESLILKLAKYPETVKKAGESYDPAEIAKYLFELAQDFNDYYHSVPVLKADDDIREARLAMLYAISQVLRNGLKVLGVEALEEM
ncbi:arginine--tRNA ligase [bacterium (Candidatus Gribaldobacteria) CG02_land_8_20_14_3_00_41_15]|uniref:Arginine--tRNA ligase n=2 Tax=Bacteria candidate phyla TaxID=1783234 RepID=A0A2M7DEW4_9BACT|nr:MAG: arginine--tRNA ligase [bacterium (Candidatus Gribaldobacteria) CG02_land_8_20_14_3_00_41_15]